MAQVARDGIDRESGSAPTRRRHAFRRRLGCAALAAGSLLVWRADAWLQRHVARLPRHEEGATQLWAHRGYHEGAIEENSLASLDAALQHGYAGVEVDVHYVPGRGIFISHDDIEPGEEAGLVPLRDFLARHGAAMSYWIDFKNLG